MAIEKNLETNIKDNVEKAKIANPHFITVVLSIFLKMNPLDKAPTKVTTARKEKKKLTFESECKTDFIKFGRTGEVRQVAIARVITIQAKNLPTGCWS